MAFFYPYETCDLTIVLDRENALADVDDVMVTLSQCGKRSININTGLDIDENSNTIVVSLTQSQTGRFCKGEVDVQVNILYETGERDTSEIASLTVLDQTYEAVMTE